MSYICEFIISLFQSLLELSDNISTAMSIVLCGGLNTSLKRCHSDSDAVIVGKESGSSHILEHQLSPKHSTALLYT